jgi:hypothetical protein
MKGSTLRDKTFLHHGSGQQIKPAFKINMEDHMKSSFALRSILVAAGLSMAGMSAQAAVVFDAVTGGQGNYNQGFVTTSNPPIAELGDIITLGGSDRLVNAVSFRMAQQTLVDPNPYTAAITFSLYSVNTTTLATSLLGAVTNPIQIFSTGILDLSFNFNNVAVPGTIYYGISVSSASANVNGLAVVLWDYWSVGSPNFGDGPVLPVGTDPGTVINGPSAVTSIVYGRLTPGGALIASTNSGLGVNDLSLGMTPSVQISAVPEPETYGLMALGLVALGAYVRRRKQA